MTRQDSGRLASSIGELKPHYDVVVVGSGYGGAVTAARLAEHGASVCILERGRELRPGDYPDTLVGALREFQIDLPGRHLFSPSALYDLRINPDMSVFVGCGLGGTSLINANVALKPDKSVLTSSEWPARIRAEASSGDLKRWFENAKRMLDVQTSDLERPRKHRVLDEILGGESPSAPLTVKFPKRDGEGWSLNHVGVPQHPCTGCGDCVSGCNYAAKNTLIMNYLPTAKREGAAIFTEMKASSVEPVPGGKNGARWRVHFHPLGSGRERFGSPPLSITARTVILAAGVMGSTEILFRSKRAWKLPLSNKLGARFSANGDVLAFSYNDRKPTNAVGFGARSAHGLEAPGPCISGFIQWPGILLEDGVIPGALSPILTAGFVLARLLTSGESPMPRDARGGSMWRLLGRYLRGGVSSTQTFLAMVDDPDYGELVEDDGRTRVRWRDAGGAPVYAGLKERLVKAADKLDGTYVPSPLGQITVHPLGGCVMADRAEDGVVDDSGRVFKGASGGDGHDGLYVCDASIIPRALGVNPLFTITALAERAASLIRP